MHSQQAAVGITSRTELRELLRFASAWKEAGILPHVQLSLFKEMILSDDEAIIRCQQSIGPKPRDPTNEAFLRTVQTSIRNVGKLLLEKLFEDYPLDEAHMIANSDRDECDVDVASLIYGEVDYDAFAEVLNIATKDKKQPRKFYDLGSGVGRAVFVAALNIDFEELIGIELLGGLHAASQAIATKFYATTARSLVIHPLVRFMRGNILDLAIDWTDGDVVFANSTCFSQWLLDGIAAKGEQMKPGAILITFSTALTSLWFRVIFKKRYTMSWGPATVFIHVKLDEAGYAQRLREHTEYDRDQAVVYPTEGEMQEGSEYGDVDSMHVHFSETSSVVDPLDAAEELLSRMRQDDAIFIHTALNNNNDNNNDEKESNEPDSVTQEMVQESLQIPVTTTTPSSSEEQQEEEDVEVSEPLPETASSDCMVVSPPSTVNRSSSNQFSDSGLSSTEEALYEQIRNHHNNNNNNIINDHDGHEEKNDNAS